MIIVSDSGPLAYLILIGFADYLPQLYGEVYLPPSVLDELKHPRSPVIAWTHSLPGWLKVATPKLIQGFPTLDVGEREAIALALELDADRLLMDEKQGRSAATAAGLQVAGTLAVIVDGARKGLFDGFAALERLAATNFYASRELIEHVRALLVRHGSGP
ncbi:MAG: hypothetical protein AB7G28_06070 [Pirellulales bacterium]